jgi:tRNA modification GTPase
MSYDLESTIVALASPPGGAARGIVRASGPNTLACVAACFEPASAGPPLADEQCPPRRATVVSGRAVVDQPALRFPCDLWLWPTPKSYTGQPAAEFHTLGSPPLLEALVAALCRAGARPAGPGEFTLRAFLTGRIDLTQAEAVLGVIEAQGPTDLEAALDQLAGGLGRPLMGLRGRLLDLLADLEAGLDFADEDLEFIAPERLAAELAAAEEHVAAAARQLGERRAGGDLPRVVLAGPPNAGKSSLFNALAGAARALVSEVAGTTRDYLTAELDCGGVRCELVDTAGREDRPTHPNPKRKRGSSPQAIADQARRFADHQRRQAALVLECRDAQGGVSGGGLAANAGSSLLVLTKSDLLIGPPAGMPAGQFTSSRTGQGLAELRRQIGEALSSHAAEAVGPAATAARCGDSLRRAQAGLEQARLAAGRGAPELAAAELRTALDALGEVVGAVYTEDLLDRIFSRFCIGK